MGLGVRAAPFTYMAHALAVAAAAMVLYWCIHFRGGLALEAVNKNLIFNVSRRSVFFFFFSPVANRPRRIGTGLPSLQLQVTSPWKL